MKRIIEFKGNDYSDLYWFDDKTNEREFIRTVKNVKGMKCSNVTCNKEAEYILDGIYFCKDHYPYSWQDEIIEMTKDEPLGDVFKTKNMSDDLIPAEQLAEVRRMGFNGYHTYCKIFKWFRQKWKYVSWIEQAKDKFIYKVSSKGIFHRPKKATNYPHCKNYEKAQLELLKELIIIVKETR